jgi:hypothetical protein
MVKPTTTQHLPLWKRMLEVFVIVFIFLVIVIVGFQLFRVIYEHPPEDMIKISDQFAPGRSWELVTVKVEPKRVLCVDVECPSVWKQWKTEFNITRTDFSELIRSMNWNLKIDGDCAKDSSSYGDNIGLCSASGIIDSYNVKLTLTTSNPFHYNYIGLNIWKKS